MDCWCHQNLDVAFEGTLKLINSSPGSPLWSTTWNSWREKCECHLLSEHWGSFSLLGVPGFTHSIQPGYQLWRGLLVFRRNGTEQPPSFTLRLPTGGGGVMASVTLLFHYNVCGGWDVISSSRAATLLAACLHVEWILWWPYFSCPGPSQNPLCLLKHIFILSSTPPTIPSWITERLRECNSLGLCGF